MWADTHYSGTSALPSNLGSRRRQRTPWRDLRNRLEHAIVLPARAWLRLQREMAELSRLEERDLADLGITRGDFAAIRSGAFTRDEQQAELRPLVFRPIVGPLEDEEPKSTRAQETLPIFLPFGSDPSWFERYWYGETSSRR